MKLQDKKSYLRKEIKQTIRFALQAKLVGDTSHHAWQLAKLKIMLAQRAKLMKGLAA
jgi:hypothetical protein